MKISILGTGRVGSSLAQALHQLEHEVVVGTRNPEESKQKWQLEEVRLVSLADAASMSPIVINATPGDSALATLTSLQAALKGKILLDVANATVRLPNGLPGKLCYPESSLAEKIQTALPQTRVVKALNTMLFSVMIAPQSLKTPPTAFISGNDSAAKGQVAMVLRDLGWQPEWIMDLGDIQSARASEALILLAPHIIQHYGFAPFAIGILR